MREEEVSVREKLTLLGPAGCGGDEKMTKQALDSEISVSARAYLYFLCTKSKMASKVKSGAVPLAIESWDT